MCCSHSDFVEEKLHEEHKMLDNENEKYYVTKKKIVKLDVELLSTSIMWPKIQDVD